MKEDVIEMKENKRKSRTMKTIGIKLDGQGHDCVFNLTKKISGS